MTSKHAPIAVFAYNRPDHLDGTLRSLVACDGADASPITVFIDGQKEPASTDVTEQVRKVASDVLGTNADIRVASANLGLSKSILSGVGNLIDKNGRVIVVEDDLILAPAFLNFMNSALERYSSLENVYQISGHMFDVREFADRQDALFLPLTTTWGWATWGRAWKSFDATATGWQHLRQDRQLRRRFDLDGAYPYTWLMERQQQGQSDSWGIRWYWSVFRRGGVSLFPPVSLVGNTGQDGSGTHGRGVMADFKLKGGRAAPMPPKLPEDVTVRKEDFTLVKNTIWRQNGGWRGWSINQLRQWIGI